MEGLIEVGRCIKIITVRVASRNVADRGRTWRGEDGISEVIEEKLGLPRFSFIVLPRWVTRTSNKY